MHRSLAAAMVLAATAFASQALAHAHLISSNPAAGATVTGVKAVSLQLSEALEPKYSGLELYRNGTPVPAKVAVAATDMKAIVAEPAHPLAPGAYKVSWHAVSTDGHRTKGEFAFKVR